MTKTKTKTKTIEPSRWDAILAHSTANNNAHALTRNAEDDLVYADLQMGLV